MPYKHGIKISEVPTSLASPVTSVSGLQVVFGTAPINLADNPYQATNKLILAHSMAEAVAALGYSDDYENYTLCQSMDICFKLFNVAPVIFCNVLDPAVHKATVSATDCTVANRQATLSVKGMLLDTVVVAVGETTLTETTHYVASFDENGHVVINFTAAGITALNSATTVKVSGTKIDPTAVTATDIIGGVDVSTGVETGLELIRKVYPKFNLFPGFIIAPGWSQKSAVGAAMAAKCVEINGLFTSECILDISASSADSGATKYTDIETAKNTLNYNSKHSIVVWPMALYNNKKVYLSAVVAALMAAADAENDNVPSMSPSNKALHIAGTVLADGTEVNLDEPQANTLNGIGVVTAININGWKAWGNNMACYPEFTDPKDRWIHSRRFFSWQGNTFIVTYFDKVDDYSNYRLIESIVDEENIRGNSLVAQGKVAGMRMEYNVDENPTTALLDGRIKFHQYLAPFIPAEYIENVLEFSPSMLESALAGGEEE